MQCSAAPSQAFAGGLQAQVRRGSFHIAQAAADAYAKSQSDGDDDSTPANTPVSTPASSAAPSTPSEPTKDVRIWRSILAQPARPTSTAKIYQRVVSANMLHAEGQGLAAHCASQRHYRLVMAAMPVQDAAFNRQRWIAFLAMFTGYAPSCACLVLLLSAATYIYIKASSSVTLTSESVLHHASGPQS